MSTEATLAEPRAKGDTAAEVKSSSSAVPVTTATLGAPGIVHDGSGILEQLTPSQLRAWKIDGTLPEGVDTEAQAKRPKREITNEHEKLLAKLTPAERKVWAETYELPERLTNPKEEKSAAKAEVSGDKELSALAESTVSPIVRVHAQMFVDKDGLLKVRDGKDDEVSALIADSRGKYDDRLKADRDSYSIADRTETLAAWKILEPQLPTNLVGYLSETVNKLLEKPWTFFRAFSTDAAFRQKVLTALAGKDGSIDKMLRAIARFDAEHAPKPASKVSRAPAPAASISGHATAPLDEVAAAVTAGDFRRFRLAENRAEHLRRTWR